MTQTEVIEGTTEEIARLLNGGAFAGRKLRVIVEPEEDFSEDRDNPPNTVRDASHLEQLWLDGLASPAHEVTDETWEETRREVRRRHAARQQ